MSGLGMARGAGLAAVAGGTLMAFSDLLNLTVYVPGLGEAAHTGFGAVGSGVILLAMTLLFVGVVGLFAGANAGPARADGPTVIEYGDARARYVLVESQRLRPSDAGHTYLGPRVAARATASAGPAAHPHRTGRGG